MLYHGRLTPLDSIFLLLLAVLWLVFIVKIARLGEVPREGSLSVACLWLGVALIIMPMVTRIVVDNAMVVANFFAISELTIGLTVIAIDTDLPELATPTEGARKGEDDIVRARLADTNCTGQL